MSSQNEPLVCFIPSKGVVIQFSLKLLQQYGSDNWSAISSARVIVKTITPE